MRILDGLVESDFFGVWKREDLLLYEVNIILCQEA